MKNRMMWKFWGANVFLILVAILILNFFIKLRLQDYYDKKISDKLAGNAFLVGDVLKDDIMSDRESDVQNKVDHISRKLGVRITVLAPDGAVLGESESDPEAMENHVTREEVVTALRSGLGECVRRSITLGQNMKYLAVTVRDDDRITGIVRLAIPLTDIDKEVGALNRIFILGGILAAVVTLLIAYFISKNITLPVLKMSETANRIAEGDLSKRVEVYLTDELGDLARAFNHMADELQNTIDDLKKTDRIRTDFVANVSHELKTPLTSIKGFIETLQDGAIKDAEAADKFLAIIAKQADRLSNIVNDLLVLTELENPGDILKKTRFDSKGLLDDVIWSYGSVVSVRDQKMNADYRGDDFNIRADRDKVEQVMINIIDNAVKYSGKNGEINISLFEEKDNVMLTVEDNGPGIPEEHLERIYERFYRVDKSRSREIGGTGLGLSIVKHIVKLHDGRIDIESEMGKGTRVTVFFPK